MSGTTQTTGLITYEEAAALLGKNAQAVRSLVWRGQLHTYPDPHDKRRRLLSPAEVQTYIIKLSQRAMQATVATVPARAATPGINLDITPKMLGAIAGSIALIALLMFIFKNSAGDTATQVLVMGAIAGLALLVIAEWQEQGRISQEEARRLERLAKKAEADQAHAEAFMSELEKVIAASGASA